MSNSTQVAAGRAITVPFHGADLYVVEHNGQPYTPMKPIVAAMGLDWGSQFRKVAANESRWGIVNLTIPSAGGEQAMTCLPVRKTAAWLTTIEPGKVKSPQVRARVIQYQNECDDALWHYWNEGIAVNPRALYSVSPGDVLTGEEAEALRLMLTTAVDRLPKHKRAAAMVKGWSKLKAHFHVSYRQIPRSEFTEALSIVARHTAEWDLVDEAPSSGALNEQVARMVRQVEGPNGTPVEVFMPLVNAVLSKCGLRSPVSRAQQEAITTRLDRLGMLFHPMSDQAADLVGILRALRGRCPVAGMQEPGFMEILPAPRRA
ncbi:phage antirepressor N-terminal domain-containing protein [Paracidovorax citrulli]|uniref:phage antirepressor N-terminal domain-containing protein n=1 Tax=Paracidovorax citrulli TaxID=80869 RepID=UPI000697E5E9|nr:phage antirepressor N-terminal domain-containing protein [Paracidovorax citrulli]